MSEPKSAIYWEEMAELYKIELAAVTKERDGLAAFINDLCQMTAMDSRMDIVMRCIAERDALRVQVEGWKKAHDSIKDVCRTIAMQRDEYSLQVEAMREAFQDMASMPEYDQDDAHRLRHKAKHALTGPFHPVVRVDEVLPSIMEYKAAIYWSVPHPDAPEPFTSEYLGELYNQAENLVTKLEAMK